VLGISGYSPNVEQSEHVLFSLRLLYALVPSVCNLIGLFIALAYPINSTRHEEIRSAIEKRARGLPVSDPLDKKRQLNPFSRQWGTGS
jgi:GPH family glycoside/pentoside/hexuronide:cation symporter